MQFKLLMLVILYEASIVLGVMSVHHGTVVFRPTDIMPGDVLVFVFINWCTIITMFGTLLTRIERKIKGG